MEWVSSFADRFRSLTEHQTVQQAADFLKVGKTSIVYWQSGQRKPKIPTVNYIAQKYGVNSLWLLGGDVPKYGNPLLGREDTPDNIFAPPKSVQKPLIGDIACGVPILAEENIEKYISAPEGVACDFCLRCRGDSMIGARIFDGDIVFVRQQETVESGQIAVVLIDNEATLKRVRLYPDHIVLEPENPQYRPMVFWDEEMSQVRIEGLAVAFLSTVR